MNGLLRRGAITCAVVAAVLSLLAFKSVEVAEGDDYQTPNLAHEAAPPISNGVFVRQVARASGESIQSISLKLATYQRQNTGNATLRVEKKVGERWVVLSSKSFPKRNLVDNAFKKLTFHPALKIKPGQPFALTLSADGDVGQAITWWILPGFRPRGYQLLINGSQRAATAHFAVGYRAVSSPVYRQLPRLWKRATAFHKPSGKAVLAFGIAGALVCFVHLMLWGYSGRTRQ
jgi:hypothetical protein